MGVGEVKVCKKYVDKYFSIVYDIFLPILAVQKDLTMTKHSQLRGNRVTTSINVHSRTLDILKHVKKARDERGIMSIFDKLFSMNKDERTEAMGWLINFHNVVLLNNFTFDESVGHWEFSLNEAPDVNFPVVPKSDIGKYHFDKKGNVVYNANHSDLG